MRTGFADEAQETTDTQENVTEEVQTQPETSDTEDAADAEDVEESLEESIEIVEESADTVEEQVVEGLDVGTVTLTSAVSVAAVLDDEEVEEVIEEVAANEVLKVASEEAVATTTSEGEETGETEDSNGSETPEESDTTSETTTTETTETVVAVSETGETTTAETNEGTSTTAVAQIDSTTYETLDAAISEAENNDTIVLLDNIAAPTTGNTNTLSLNSAKEITLNLNGKTLNGNNIAIFVNNAGAVLTIVDEPDESDDSEETGGKVTNSGGSGAVRVMSGKVVIESGTFEATGNVLRTSGSDAIIVVEDGTFTSTASDTINNGGGTIEINGGTFNASTSGKVIVALSTEKSESGGLNCATSVEINDGTFNNSVSYNYEGIGYQEGTGYGGIITIYGGTYKSNSDWLVESYLADGYAISSSKDDDENITYTVAIREAVLTYEASDETITKGFTGVQSAVYYIINNSISNSTITMNGNYTGRVTVSNEITLTLDLNGYTITTDTDDGIALLVSAGNVTVTDGSTTQKGTITMNSGNSNGSALVRVTGGTVTLAGGHYKPASTQGTIGVDAGAKLTVTGGYYTFDLTESEYLVSGYQVATTTDEENDYPYYVAKVIVGQDIDVSSGVIAVNVYINGSEVENASEQVSIDPASTNGVNVGEYTEGSYENATLVLTQNVVAKKMADVWTVKVALDNGYAVEYETSVKKCAEEQIGTNTETDEAKALKAMLNYGAAVQEYDSYSGTENVLANSGTGIAYTTELSGVDASSMLSAGVKKTTTKSSENYSGATLQQVGMVLGYDFEIDLTYTSNVTVTSVKLGDTTLTEDTNYTVSVSKISITGLSAADLNKTLVITLSDGTNTYTTTMSALYYARLLTDTASRMPTEAEKFLGQTLYKYATAVAGLSTSRETEEG